MKKIQTERIMQRECVRWFDLQYGRYSMYLFSIPNGGKRDALHAMRLKQEGVRAGVPDMMLALPSKDYAGLFIELKCGNNRPTSNQSNYLDALTQVGYKCVVIRSLEEFINTITDYIHQCAN